MRSLMALTVQMLVSDAALRVIAQKAPFLASIRYLFVALSVIKSFCSACAWAFGVLRYLKLMSLAPTVISRMLLGFMSCVVSAVVAVML